MKNYRTLFGTLTLGIAFSTLSAFSLAGSKVISISNQTTGNYLQVFSVQSNGSLIPSTTIPTGGIGTGGGLGSQGAVAADDQTGLIAAVNAGDNTVSVFQKYGDSIKLVSRVPSRGYRPVSVTLRKNIMFVLNQGDANHPSNVQGFHVFLGNAIPIAFGGSTGLSASYTNPAQVSFSPNGRSLVVTEKATNKIGVIDIMSQGQILGTHYTDSNGTTPFGFAFDASGNLFVTEAFGGAANSSAVSSYQRRNNGYLRTISASIPTTQTAACWAAVTPDNKFVFSANAGSGTISAYRIGIHGIIDLQSNSSAIPGSTPVDMALGKNGRFVYLLGAGIPGVVTYSVANDGSLTQIDTDSAVRGSAGLAFAR